MISAFRRWTNKPLDRGKALSAFLVNQLSTPGLGSLAAGRRISGSAQLLLASAGFGLIMAWFIRVMIVYYSLMLSDVPSTEPDLQHGLWRVGTVLFGVAWLWSLVTSISLMREARANAKKALAQDWDQPPVIADHNARP